MDNNLMISWGVAILLLIISLVLLLGKGSFLIAGYNTASKKEKGKYDKLKLCRTVGSGGIIISILFMVFSYYQFELPSHLSWLIPWGLFGIILIIFVLVNTYCRKQGRSNISTK